MLQPLDFVDEDGSVLHGYVQPQLNLGHAYRLRINYPVNRYGWDNDYPDSVRRDLRHRYDGMVRAFLKSWRISQTKIKIGWTDYVRYKLPELNRQLFPQELLEIKHFLREDALRLEPHYEQDLLFGDATQVAADNALKFTGNTATLIKELLGLKDTILDLYRLLQGDVNLKNLSSLWLSGRYGLKLTYQDTVDLAKSVLDEVKRDYELYSLSRGRAGDNPVARCILYFDPNTRNGFAKAMSGLMEWDLFPSLANVWDIIPYSFVVDWFVDVEGFLSAIDTNTYLSTMNVFSAFYTLKTEWEVPVSTWHGIQGNFWFTRFKRFSKNEPIPPVPSFSGSLPSEKNIIDGAALIIQRL